MLFVGCTHGMLIFLPARGTFFECSAEVSWESVSLYTAESSQIGNISVYASEMQRKIFSDYRSSMVRVLCLVASM